MLKRFRDGSALAMVAFSVLLAGCGASNPPPQKVEARQVIAPARSAPSAAPPGSVKAPDTQMFPLPRMEDPAVDLARCERGDMEGCRAAGWLFLHGFGVVEDAPRADDLYRKACHGKNTKACMEFAMEYYHWHDWPIKATEEVAEAAQHQLACDHGDKEGCLALALDVLRHTEKLSIWQGTVGKTARKTAEDACAASNIAACSTLLELARRSEDERRAEAIASKLLAMCRAGEARACEPVVGYPWMNKTQEERRSLWKETGLTWCKYTEAECRAGRAGGCSSAFDCVDQYGYDPQGPASAGELTYHACVSGRDFKQCAKLADRFQLADGVPHDPEKARFFDLAACQHGVHDGCWHTVNRLKKQGGGPEIDKKIFEVTKMGCRIDERDSSWLLGCMELARLYETGQGTPKDVEKAVEIFTAVCQHIWEGCSELRRLKRPVPPGAADADEP